jgi:hypothetical protein
MLTGKDYCDYETCVALKKLGFNDVTHYFFNKDGIHTPRIPLYEAQKFLREEKSIYVTVGCPLIMNEGLGWSYEVCDKPWNGHSDDDCVKASGGAYDSYEEAISEGLRTAIKILKEK